MNKSSFLLITLLVFTGTLTEAQESGKSDPASFFEKAKFLNGNLTGLLSKTVKYPDKAFFNNVEGDVIFSFVIKKDGKLDSISILKSPDMLLTTSSITAFDLIEGDWSPYRINGTPTDKRYLLIFRYRIFMNSQPPDYKNAAAKNFEKLKYEKALKLYDSAIENNKWDFSLFESRARLKETMGNPMSARQDYQTSSDLRNNVIGVVNVNIIGRTRTESKTVVVHSGPGRTRPINLP